MKQKVEQNKKRKMYGKSKVRLSKKGNHKQTYRLYQPRLSDYITPFNLDSLK